MTASDAKSLKLAGALLLGLLIPFLVALTSSAWSSKESVADHNRDVDAIHQDVQRILDVLCDGKKAIVRACKS